ncbi:hypothetical protein SFUMM280S_08017 [Streptomyces fumanus]
MDEPNVLFLDEPTNDLDIETLTQLEDLLDGWPGSMIVISHDRFFIERTTDRVFALLGDGTLRMLPRGIDEYLERRQRMEEAAAAAAGPAPAKAAAEASRGGRRRPAGRQEGTPEDRTAVGQDLQLRLRRRPRCTRGSPSTPPTSPRSPNSTPSCASWRASARNWSCAGWNSPKTRRPRAPA